jgi:hypothetical protein
VGGAEIWDVGRKFEGLSIGYSRMEADDLIKKATYFDYFSHTTSAIAMSVYQAAYEQQR